ncbi:MAG: hypothetical protein HQL51_05670 [Magnetococcales bacterium]|nr:hypothetical protein [Magnetococcales bacterium]
MQLISAIPLFAYLFVIYHVLALLGGAGGTLLDTPLFAGTLVSGAQFTMRVNELILLLGVLCLYIEIFKATRSGVASIFDHLFSMATFVLYLVTFLIYSKAGTATYLLLMLMSCLDVVAGFTVTISTARRDVGFGREEPHG